MSMDAAVSWDAEYQRGRYAGEPPLPFIDDVLRSVDDHGLRQAAALDIGAGNGRNLRRMLEAGLDVTALDISQVAIDQLAAEFPYRRDRFVCGDLAALPEAAMWPVILGIQVFQHGDRTAAHEHIRRAPARVASGGLFAIRVNAADGSDLWPTHEILEPHEPDLGLAIRYLDGPKTGLTIHFFDIRELQALFADGYTPVLAPPLASTQRTAPAPGRWTQIEAIWRRTP